MSGWFISGRGVLKLLRDGPGLQKEFTHALEEEDGAVAGLGHRFAPASSISLTMASRCSRRRILPRMVGRDGVTHPAIARQQAESHASPHFMASAADVRFTSHNVRRPGLPQLAWRRGRAGHVVIPPSGTPKTRRTSDCFSAPTDLLSTH